MSPAVQDANVIELRRPHSTNGVAGDREDRQDPARRPLLLDATP
jgi:hypothetical protein